MSGVRGTQLIQRGNPSGVTVCAQRERTDFRNPSKILSRISSGKPDLISRLTAFTAPEIFASTAELRFTIQLCAKASKGSKVSRIGLLDRFNVASPSIANGDEVSARAPREFFASGCGDHHVCHQARMTAVTIGPRMNDDQSMVETNGRFGERINGSKLRLNIR